MGGNDPIKHNDPLGDEQCCQLAMDFLNTTMQTQNAIIQAGGGAQDRNCWFR